MPGKRFLPDLIVMALALFAGPALLRVTPGAARRALRALIAAGSALLIAGILVTLLEAADYAPAFRWMMPSGLALAWGVSLIAATVLGFCFRHIPKPPVSPERRRLLTISAGAAMAAPAATLGYGMFVSRRQFRLQEVDLEVPGMAPALDGLRVVQLSDIHLSPFLSRSDLRWCVAMANETRPHFAAVTGDLITGIRDSIDDCLEELRHLRTDAGVFGCNGNHERYVGGEAYTAERAARLGMKFLRAERTSLRFGSELVNLAGIDHEDDLWNYALDTEGLQRPGELNLLLNHNPGMFPHIVKQRGWDVTLSGHMHGGQINLELANANINLVRFTTPYVYGIYREGRSAMYVTRGIGTIGMPVRLGAPPEVALIRLRAVPAIL
jgi:predicted MPP superfamily phosphohydrolase